MPKAKYTRQSSIINLNDVSDNEITIVGCGAVGSYVGMTLAKMGLTKFILYDFDLVEAHNLPNQFFTEEDIGLQKAIATFEHMTDFNSDAMIKVFGKFTKKTKLTSQIVISCVDKMSVRKEIFDVCKKSKSVQLFIDTRMGGFEGQVYSIDMENKKEIKNYEKTLFSDEEAANLRCTERSIIFTVLGVASLVSNQIVKALNEEKLANFITIDYKVPQLF